MYFTDNIYLFTMTNLSIAIEDLKYHDCFSKKGIELCVCGDCLFLPADNRFVEDDKIVQFYFKFKDNNFTGTISNDKFRLCDQEYCFDWLKINGIDVMIDPLKTIDETIMDINRFRKTKSANHYHP
jgi:hypothetical protein